MTALEYKDRFHNLGWLFYRNTFDDRLPRQNPRLALDFGYLLVADEKERKARKKELEEANAAAFKVVNEDITSFRFPEIKYGIPATHWLSHKTTYPGLLIGSGYTHETGVQGEFKLGFFFDHTSGLPIIPGSSVKGVLRSAFPNAPQNGSPDEGVAARRAFIKDLIQVTNQKWVPQGMPVIKLSGEEIDALENDIFESRREKEIDGTKAWEYHKSVYKRDIFFDAVITAVDQKKKILGNDFITPHINRKHPELSPFTNPIPLQFLKVLPGVTFTFGFRLHDSLIGNVCITARQKEALFNEILLTLGVGAKTNVGYGQFEQPILVGEPFANSPEIDSEVASQVDGLAAQDKKVVEPEKPQLPLPLDFLKLKGNGKEVVIGRVMAIKGSNVEVKLHVENFEQLVLTASRGLLESSVGRAFYFDLKKIEGKGVKAKPVIVFKSIAPINE